MKIRLHFSLSHITMVPIGVSAPPPRPAPYVTRPDSTHYVYIAI